MKQPKFVCFLLRLKVKVKLAPRAENSVIMTILKGAKKEFAQRFAR